MSLQGKQRNYRRILHPSAEIVPLCMGDVQNLWMISQTAEMPFMLPFPQSKRLLHMAAMHHKSCALSPQLLEHIFISICTHFLLRRSLNHQQKRSDGYEQKPESCLPAELFLEEYVCECHCRQNVQLVNRHDNARFARLKRPVIA